MLQQCVVRTSRMPAPYALDQAHCLASQSFGNVMLPRLFMLIYRRSLLAPLPVRCMCDLLVTQAVVFERLRCLCSVHRGGEDVVQTELPWKDVLCDMQSLRIIVYIPQALQDVDVVQPDTWVTIPTQRRLRVQHSVPHKPDVGQASLLALSFDGTCLSPGWTWMSNWQLPRRLFLRCQIAQGNATDLHEVAAFSDRQKYTAIKQHPAYKALGTRTDQAGKTRPWT